MKRKGAISLHIVTITGGALDTNCYMVWEKSSRKCVLIDPGFDGEQILARTEGKTVEAILLTHGHFDHVGGVKRIAEKTGCRVYLCAGELTLPEQLTDGALYYTDLYGEGDTLTAGGLTFTVLHTPGHTPGCVCLLCGDAMFSGDTLFAGTCGRTDLPGGDPGKMQTSLNRLAELEGSFRVLPGHGNETTLDAERRYNPYMKK